MSALEKQKIPVNPDELATIERRARYIQLLLAWGVGIVLSTAAIAGAIMMWNSIIYAHFGQEFGRVVWIVGQSQATQFGLIFGGVGVLVGGITIAILLGMLIANIQSEYFKRAARYGYKPLTIETSKQAVLTADAVSDAHTLSADEQAREAEVKKTVHNIRFFLGWFVGIVLFALAAAGAAILWESIIYPHSVTFFEKWGSYSIWLWGQGVAGYVGLIVGGLSIVIAGIAIAVFLGSLIANRQPSLKKNSDQGGVQVTSEIAPEEGLSGTKKPRTNNIRLFLGWSMGVILSVLAIVGAAMIWHSIAALEFIRPKSTGYWILLAGQSAATQFGLVFGGAIVLLTGVAIAILLGVLITNSESPVNSLSDKIKKIAHDKRALLGWFIGITVSSVAIAGAVTMWNSIISPTMAKSLVLVGGQSSAVYFGLIFGGIGVLLGGVAIAVLLGSLIANRQPLSVIMKALSNDLFQTNKATSITSTSVLQEKKPPSYDTVSSGTKNVKQSELKRRKSF